MTKEGGDPGDVDAVAAIADPVERAAAAGRLLGRILGTEAMTAIADPVERAVAAGPLLGQMRAAYESGVRDVHGMRRDAILAAQSELGMNQAQVARAMGLTPGRIHQMLRVPEAADQAAADRPPRVVTGWAAGPGPVAASIAICGSTSGASTDKSLVDAAVLALADLLMHHRYELSHGPQGVGAEVLTWIADHYHPAGLDASRGIYGHPNVVRDADYVLIVGGGQGTMAEAEAAISAGDKCLLPMPLTGGTAAAVYLRMLGDARLRDWMARSVFEALSLADASRYAQIAQTTIAAKEG